MARIVVLETHRVFSEDVPPNRMNGDDVLAPKPCPKIVKEADPVVGEFIFGALLMTGASNDDMNVTVDAAPALVTVIIRLLCSEAAILHANEVCEDHMLFSLLLWPTRTIEVVLKWPKPMPLTLNNRSTYCATLDNDPEEIFGTS